MIALVSRKNTDTPTPDSPNTFPIATRVSIASPSLEKIVDPAVNLRYHFSQLASRER
jgi:hypothetical protein